MGITTFAANSKSMTQEERDLIGKDLGVDIENEKELGVDIKNEKDLSVDEEKK